MKSILVPVDFSVHTHVYCQYALLIAKETGAGITLFHSFFDQVYISDAGFNAGFESGMVLTDEIMLDKHSQKENLLSELAEEMLSSLKEQGANGIKVEYMISNGDPEVQIIEAVRQLEPDLIIMGSSGLGRKRWLTGSVAKKIINHVNIPVIAVPELDEAPSVKNLAYMTNFDPSDHEVITELESILATFRVNIFCIHLTDDSESVNPQQEMDKLSGNLSHRYFKNRISFHILSAEDNQEPLRIFMDENKIDILAFIPHKRNIFKNLVFQGLTKEDLFLFRIPVMAIKPSN
jgi:nucleotide-binding universal stress UspA family protein